MGARDLSRLFLCTTMHSPEETTKAIERFLDGTATATDLKIVADWYESFEDETVVIPGNEALRQEVKERMKVRLQDMIRTEKEIHPKSASRKISRIWYQVAAVFLILIAGSLVYRYYISVPEKPPVQLVQQPILLNDIAAPLSSHATLTLADGTRVSVDSAASGAIAQEGQTRILKQADGNLRYEGAGGQSGLLYNTLSVPRGSRVVTLTLADGTQAWLNAESSLRYPVAASGMEHKVFISGEVYFEVHKNPHRRFLVAAGNTSTEVMGTHFNVNAYAENNMVKVTLLEGLVKVSAAGTERSIVPGQQAQLLQQGIIKLANKPDLEAVMAWKNGLFKFDKEDLQSIMRTIQRWYNVDLAYEGTMRRLTFGGMINRKENASAVLDLLELTGVVKFRIASSTGAGRAKIYVTIL